MIPQELVVDAVLAAEIMNDPRWERRWSYYSGAHPRVYLSTKLMELFRGLTDAMADNYLGLAVNSRVSRLEILGWDDDTAQGIWEGSRLPQRQDRLFRWALAYGQIVVVVDEDEEGPHLRVNRPTQAVAIEDDENPDEYRFAAKRWVDSDGFHLTLMYPDEMVRLWRPPGKTVDPEKWQPDPGDPGGPHAYGKVPAVAVRPFADGPVLMDTLASPQDRINKITSNKMVASEFSAFAQRVFFTRQSVDPYDLRQAPDHAILLDPGEPGANARVEQLPAGDIGQYTSDRTDEVDNLFTLACLPRHMRVNPGTPPSGQAIRADEGPFTEQLADHQREIGEALISTFEIMGLETEPSWRGVEASDDLMSTQAFATAVGAGIPWQIAAREYLHWDEEMVAEAEQVQQESTAGQQGLGEALLSQFTVNPEIPPATPPTVPTQPVPVA